MRASSATALTSTQIRHLLVRTYMLSHSDHELAVHKHSHFSLKYTKILRLSNRTDEVKSVWRRRQPPCVVRKSPCILWIPNVHHRINNCLPLVHTPRQTNPINTLPSTY